MSSTIKIILHGYLKDLCPMELSFSGRTVAEIINGLCKQTKAFNVPYDKMKHIIKIMGFETEASLYAELPPDLTELHLVPHLGGGKSGGFIQIVLGAVLIAASFIPGLQPIGFAGFSLATSMMSLGLSFVIGGLIALISPAPKMDGSGNVTDPDGSKYLGASQNTTAIGTRIPLLYGRCKGFGQYLSFDVDAVDVAL